MNPEIRSRDTIDLREVAGAFRRGLRWLPAGVALGLLGALVVNQLPHRYESEATVVLRDRADQGTAGFSMDFMDGMPSGIGDALQLPGAFGGEVETEAAILAGRALMREIVDELGLQVRVVRPRATSAHRLFREIRMESAAPRGRFTFRRSGGGGGGWQVRGTGGFRNQVEDGGTVELPGGRLTLGSEGLPDRFTVQVRSQWETVDRIRRRGEVEVDKAGGNLAEVNVSWGDPETASQIANRIVENYLDERRARIRSVSEERFALLGAIRDSVGAEVDSSAQALSRFYEEAGTFDPERLGDLERIGELRARVDELEVEARALDEVLRRLEDVAEVRTSDLLAFPSFLASPAINQILQRLSGLREQREQLLERRTPQDPDVLVLDRAIRNLEAELLDLSRSYRDGLNRSLSEIEGRLAGYRTELSTRPRVATEEVLLENQLELSGATYVAVQAQVARSRLDAVGEGVDLRLVDRGVPADRPRFPRRNLNLALGLLAGLLVGSVWAVAAGAGTARVTDAGQVRARLGLPVLVVGEEAPLPREFSAGEVVLVPVGEVGAGEEGRALLVRQWGVPEERLRVERPSRVREGERVLLVFRQGEGGLAGAETLLPALEAAGAHPIAAAILPRRRKG